MKPRAIRVCGYVEMTCSVLLLVVTGWAYFNYRAAVGTITQSLRETTASASMVFDRIASTTKARVDVAENTGQVLRSSRKLVQDLNAASEKQAAMLPQYAGNVEDFAASLYDFAGAMRVVANTISAQVPMRVERNGLLPVIVWGTPFEAPDSGSAPTPLRLL